MKLENMTDTQLYQNKSLDELLMNIQDLKTLFSGDKEMSYCTKQVYVEQLKKMHEAICIELTFFENINNKKNFNKLKKISKVFKGVGATIIEVSIFGVANYFLSLNSMEDTIRHVDVAWARKDIRCNFITKFMYSTMYYALIPISKEIYDYFTNTNVDHFSLTYCKLKNFCEVINTEKKNHEDSFISLENMSVTKN